MNALFITGSDIKDQTYGGPKGSLRNYLLLKEYFNVDIYEVKKKSNTRSLMSALTLYFPPTDLTDIKKVKKLYKEKQYSLVFLDGSAQGEFIKIFDKSKTKIVVFYHNCEHDYISVRFGEKNSLKKMIYQKLNDRSEKIATEESDIRITFSLRDSNQIYKYYGKKSDFIIPLSIVDNLNNFEKNNFDKSCLLFGPLGTANLEAFEWFTKNVSQKLDCKTIVAGKGFEKYKNWENDKVSVIGFVDDISKLYSKVSCVAIPLFSGGGMKVKTVEAMMFGKTIFATNEAFSGYDVDYKKIGGLCNTAEEFINNINLYIENNTDNYNEYARNLYLSKYSVEASKKLFKDIMYKLGFDKEK